MKFVRLSLTCLVILLTAAACALPLPGPEEATSLPEANTPSLQADELPTQVTGGGGLQATPAAETPFTQRPEVQTTQHDVFAPSIQSGAQAGGTQTSGAAAETPSAQGTEQRVFAPSIETGGEGGGGEELSGSGQLDPHVEIQTSLQTLAVGETITVTGTPVDIESPVYSLTLRDEGVQDAAPVVEVDSNNQQTPGSGLSQILELVSVRASEDEVIFVLRGLAQGVTTLTITASGQIPAEEGGSATGSGTGEIIITVE